MARGLVYTFGTKDDLTHASLVRELNLFQEAVSKRLGNGAANAAELALAHIEEALPESEGSAKKAAFLVTALVHAPDKLEPVKCLYRDLLTPSGSGLGLANEIRHALLAVEGIFLRKGLGLADVSPSEIKSVLLVSSSPPRRRLTIQATRERPDISSAS